ncbi:DUF6572 domain-containing protein [Paenibacillus sp. R14(2021)]|uniref:DUF6572 domain-containing protein n=1 Tax=Paenibacillus sp. R14(2021) TaxID=2859228 RepID=UPI001C615BF4|nr:DUF6572 domain-containing protein [Paenibacillus sp. R14(2021)]
MENFLAITNLDLIDFISIHMPSNTTRLSIVDDLDWSDVESHLGLMQTKVYRYLDFVESGNMDEQYPKYSNRPIEITIYAEYPIPEIGMKLIKNLKDYALRENDISLVWLRHNDVEADT